MKRTEEHKRIISELEKAEHHVQAAMNEVMVKVIRACPKSFQKTIMEEYRTLYLSRIISDAFRVIIDRTDVFIPQKDLAYASVALFVARFGKSTPSKKPKKKRSIKSTT